MPMRRVVTMGALWIGCGSSAAPEPADVNTTDVSNADAPRETPAVEPPAEIHFHDATARLGATRNGGRGCSLMDVDQDGWPDVTITHDHGVQLFHGVGDGLLLPDQDLTIEEPRAVTYADVDGDADLDLYVSSGQPRHALFRNDGGRLVDVTDAAGLGDVMDYGGEGATFGDLDGDGDLDLYLAFGAPPFDRLPADAIYGETGAQERVYLNDGTGHFTRRVDAVLAGLVGGETFQGAIFDADRDGDVDIFSVHDFRPDQLFVNDGGVFSDASATALPGGGKEATSIMGIDFGDFDQDGHIDIYGTRRSVDTLYRGTDLREPYLELFANTVVGDNATMQLTGWGAALADLDNDGDLDIVRTSNFDLGGAGSEFGGRVGYTIVLEHRLEGDEHRLHDVSDTAGAIFADAIDGWGLAVGDVDRDGDLDVLIGVGGTGPQFGADPGAVRHPQLLVNDGTGPATRRSVRVRVRAPGSKNPFAVGATVDAYGLGIRAVRIVQAGGSYLSQHDDAVHFGLGHYIALPALVVTWPGGHRTAWLGLTSGEHRLDRPLDDTQNCCTENGCSAAPTVESCLNAEAYVAGAVDACAAACKAWTGCCSELTTEYCNALCGVYLPPPDVLSCVAKATCDTMLACSEDGRLLPGGESHLGALCPPK